MNKKIEINILLELLDNKIIPDTISYRSFLLHDLKLTKDFVESSLLKNEKKLLKNYSKLINDIFIKKEELAETKKMFKTKNEIELIDFIYSTVNPIMSEIKDFLDKLEKKTGDKYWTLVKYKEFLFY